MFSGKRSSKAAWVLLLLLAGGTVAWKMSSRRNHAALTAAGDSSFSSVTPPVTSEASPQNDVSATVTSTLTAGATAVSGKLKPEVVEYRRKRDQAPGASKGRPWEQIPNWVQLSLRDRIEQLVKQPFVIWASGSLQYLELALDEAFFPGLPEDQRLRKLPSQPDAKTLLDRLEEMHVPGQPVPQLVFYRPGKERSAQTRRVLTEQVLAESADVPSSISAARAAGYEKTAEFGAVPGFVVTAADEVPGQALVAVAELLRHQSNKSVEPVLTHQAAKKLIPNDPYFSKQWHLRNTGQSGGKAGMDAKVTTVWDNYKGGGITVAVIDDGVEYTHPDLTGNYNTTSDWDYVGGDSSPLPDPEEDYHGTAVAGVIAATQGNSIGVSGAAPSATLTGYRLLGSNQTDVTESQAFAKDNSTVQVKNNSWGPYDYADELGYIGSLPRTALQNAALNGRGNLGTILVFAAGNGRSAGDQGNKDAYANSIYTFSIGAVTNSGALSYYSETGAQLIAVAPSNGGSTGIVTTDLTGSDGYNSSSTPVTSNYDADFGGTSSAAPLAAGVIALMLDANPNLGWRDVKEILLRSGTKLAPTDAGWVSRYGGDSSLPPIKHHHSYGGGMVNAQVAVDLALGWTNLPAQTTVSRTTSTVRSIPDSNATGITINFDFTGIAPTRLEMVTVNVDITHGYKGDLSIALVSPTGVTSYLATPTGADYGEDYINWTFSSNRHWGDGAGGIWKLVVKDLDPGTVGSLNDATVTLYGTPYTPVTVTDSPDDQLLPMDGSATFNSAATGQGDFLHQWYKNTTSLIVGATQDSHTIPKLALTHAGRYSCEVRNVTGKETTDEATLGVVDTTPSTQIAADGSNVSLQAKAQGPAGGPALSFKWFRGVTLLTDGLTANGSTLGGTGSSKLTITNGDVLDSDVYRCEVSMGMLTLFTGDFTIHFVEEPIVQAPAANDSTYIVSQTMTLPIVTTGFPSSYTIKGLPSGMIYNTKTGVISGRPNVSGSFLITVTAKNPAGTGTQTFTLTVQALPARTIGSFKGLLERNTTGNSDLGGVFSLKTTSTGSFTGSISRGSRVHNFTGRLAALPSADLGMPNAPSASVVIKQTSPAAQFDLTFSINPSDGRLTGTLSEGVAWSADVEAFGNPFTTASPATEYEGTYNTVLQPPGGVMEGAAPQGCSYGRLTVTKAGAATWSGKTADGNAVTLSSLIGKPGKISLHKLLYANTGSWRGWLSVVSDGPSSYAGNTVSAAMDWLKKPQPSTARSYEGGFHQTGITGLGAKWAKPVSPNIVIGLPAAGKYTFSGGGITSSQLVVSPAQDLNYTFNISDKHVVTRPLPNLAAITITLSATTGIFSGTATFSDATPVQKRTLNYAGIMISGTTNQGFGWFTLPKLAVPPQKTTVTDILSGYLMLGTP